MKFAVASLIAAAIAFMAWSASAQTYCTTYCNPYTGICYTTCQ
jgi:hypothetical protein